MSYALGHPDAVPPHFGRFVRPGMVVYDIGANVGQSALLFAQLVGPHGRVISFEPAPKPFEALLQNIAVAGHETIEAHRVALSDTCGETDFLYSDAGSSAGKLVDVEPTKLLRGATTLTVPTQTLDAMLATGTIPPPDFLKIDVEGAAAVVLRGAGSTLDNIAPEVYIELHGPEEKAGVQNELLGRGYVAETLGGERMDDLSARWASPLRCYRPV